MPYMFWKSYHDTARRQAIGAALSQCGEDVTVKATKPCWASIPCMLGSGLAHTMPIKFSDRDSQGLQPKGWQSIAGDSGPLLYPEEYL